MKNPCMQFRRSAVRLCAVIVSCIFLLSSSSMYAQNFTVSGSTIIDPSGKTFIGVGANVGGEKYAWGRNTASQTELTAVRDTWKLNLLRSNHYAIRSTTKGGSPLQTGSPFVDVVNMYTPSKVVVMEELHDFTGDLFETMSASDEQKLKDFWVGRARQYKNNPYVWFNLINEPGGSTNSGQYYNKWVSLHRELIRLIRAEGANNIIVVDGMWFGQDAGNTFDSDNIADAESAILSRGLDILKDNSNIVFSIHTYAQWGGGTSARLANFVDRVRAKGMAIIFGEAGASAGSTAKWKAGAKFGYDVAKAKGVGIIAWHWQPGDDFDLTTGGDGWGKSVNSTTNPTNLTEYGKYLWDLARLTPACTTPSAPGSLSLTVTSSSQINLSWVDNSSNEEGFRIERKTGSTGTYSQIATVGANTTTYSSTGLAASTTYFYRVRAYQGTCNSGFLTEKSATTQSGGSSGTNLLLNANFETGSLSPWSGTQVYISGIRNGGSYGARLGSSTGASATLQQTVTGLKANTTYTLSAYLRVGATSITAQLGADGYGGSKTAAAVSSVDFTRSVLTFTTGATNTSVRVYVAKPSTSTNLAYADDFQLVEGTATTATSAALSLQEVKTTEEQLLRKASIRLTQNPVKQDARVQLTAITSGAHSVILTNTDGQVIRSMRINLTANTPLWIEIPMGNVPEGVYILRLSDGTNTTTHRVLTSR